MTAGQVGLFTCVSKLGQALAMLLLGEILSGSSYRVTMADPWSPPLLLMAGGGARSSRCCAWRRFPSFASVEQRAMKHQCRGTEGGGWLDLQMRHHRRGGRCPSPAPDRPVVFGPVDRLDDPPVATDTITAAEVARHIVEPDMVLRFEHADPARRAGAYATRRFPDRQRRAANTLEFAQREVVRRLGLGEEIERDGVGRIQIMGFDTNAPHGHGDAPPHVHMHLRWPGDTGMQIGHHYIGPDGLLTENIVGLKGLHALQRWFGRGETFTAIASDGRALYSHRITPRGWLEIARPDGGAGFDRPCGDL